MSHHHAFTLAGAALQARASGALHWPDQRLLIVSDLHLGKAQRLARRNGPLLPPYETRATLTRLEEDLHATCARRVLCLGDSFDDSIAATELSPEDRQILARLMTGRDWIWIAGNHDPGRCGSGGGLGGGLGGSEAAALRIDGLTFQHMGDPARSDEVSGHYHPKARLAGGSAPCFLLNPQAGRLILPAFGAYTGGLDCGDASLRALIMAPGALAILTGRRCRAIPYSAASGFSERPGASDTSPRRSSTSR